tara:strand:- start:542 stop:745 length:204 start_codon:yes stop_codon:yes gene_type:complete
MDQQCLVFEGCMVVVARNNGKQTPKDMDQNFIELKRRLRAKNLAVAGVLAGLALMFYLVAIVKMSGG